MKTETKNPPNAGPKNITPKKNPMESDPNTSAKTAKVKRSRTVSIPSLKLALMPFCGDKLLCIVLRNEVWILESEIIRSVGIEGSNQWKEDIPEFCFAKIAVPILDCNNAELSLISMAGLFYFNKSHYEFMEDDHHYYAKVNPVKT